MHRVCSKSLPADVAAALKETFNYDEWLDERQFSVLHKIALDLLPTRSMEDELEVSTGIINVGDCEGRTPVSWAAECGNSSALESLLNHGARNSNPSYHWSPLHYATRSKSPACLSLLLENGAPVSSSDKLNQTPLHIAAANHDPTYISLLVDRGADVNARSDIGTSPLSQALSKTNIKTAEYLISHGADPNGLGPTGIIFLNEEISQKRSDCVSVLLKNGADPSKADAEGETPLHHLARSSDLRTLEIFLSADLGDMNPDVRNNAGHTAQDIMEQREEVDVDIRRAFQRLMTKLDGESSDSEFFDAEDTLPDSEENPGTSDNRERGPT